MTTVNRHAPERTYPLPSGWRARCSCGDILRGRDEADAMTAFLEHAEASHLDELTQEENGQ